MKKISLIIPCYNEEKALPIFYNETTQILSKMNCEYELVFVDDGSRDMTISVIKDFAKSDKRVKYLSFSRNFGKESAMYAGFCNADGDYIAVMDADMQDPPSLLPKMLEIIEKDGYDSVATRRITRSGEPPIRSFFARCFYKLINKISDAEIVDGARDFRLMKREMVDAIILMSERSRFSKGIFGWIGFKTFWMPYENIERVAGETKWNFWKLFKYAIEGIIDFSMAPLFISLFTGGILAFLSFVGIIVLIIKNIITGSAFFSLPMFCCVLVFAGGLILGSIGITGQYIAKILSESKKRPHYIIKETNDENTKKVN